MYTVGVGLYLIQLVPGECQAEIVAANAHFYRVFAHALEIGLE